MILQMIKPISFTQGRPTLALSLSFVLITSMIKDFVEDRKRRIQDEIENNSKVLVLNKSSNEFVEDKWKHLKEGDIVKV